MTSGEGLNAYGAATWGQFFVYQGFNAKAGWMHTSSGVDNVDEFAETLSPKSGVWRSIAMATAMRAFDMQAGDDRVPQTRRDDGPADVPTWRSHHGPIVAERRTASWIATALMWKPVPALEQSFLRTKATDLASYLAVAERKANSSNDTLFADSKGEIAFLMPQFMPLRDDRFDYTRPVDGAIRRPTGTGCTASPACRACSSRRSAGCATSTIGRGCGGAGQPEGGQLSEIHGSGGLELSRGARR